MTQNTPILFSRIALLLEQRLIELREVPLEGQKAREGIAQHHFNFTRKLTAAETEKFFFALNILTKMADTQLCPCSDCDNITAIKKIILEEKTDGSPAEAWKDPDS